MKDLGISTTDLAIWFGLIAGQAVLCAAAIKTRLFHRLPCFSVYVFCSMAESIILLVIASFASYEIYYWVFTITRLLISLLAFLTLVEFGRQVLPGLDLPQKEKALSCLLGTIALVFVFVSTWPLRFIEKRVEVGACLAIAVTFLFIAGYSRYLGLYWSRLLGGISFTLGILYLVDGVSKAIIGHYPSALVLPVRQFRQFANLIAVLTWNLVVLSPWGEHKMTEDDVHQFQAIVGSAQANVRRFIAGGSE
jgi:hypothetical protein